MTKDEIKQSVKMYEVLSRYGMHAEQGRVYMLPVSQGKDRFIEKLSKIPSIVLVVGQAETYLILSCGMNLFRSVLHLLNWEVHISQERIRAGSRSGTKYGISKPKYMLLSRNQTNLNR